MKTKELINTTFDKVIEKLQKERIRREPYEWQVYNEALDLQTDRNITQICKERKPKGL